MSNESFFSKTVSYRFEQMTPGIERVVSGASREMASTYGPVKVSIEQLVVRVSSTSSILDRFSDTFSRRCKAIGVEFVKNA